MESDLFKIKSTRETATSWFTIVEDILEIDGDEHPYSYVKVKPGVCVIAEADGLFAVLREYRYPIKQWSYEFTSGMIDKGESPAEAAAREVTEETGFTVDTLLPLGEFYPSFGATDEVIHLFYAQCGKKEAAHTEPAELITCSLMSAAQIDELIASGQFKHGAGLAAWLKFKMREK